MPYIITAARLARYLDVNAVTLRRWMGQAWIVQEAAHYSTQQANEWLARCEYRNLAQPITVEGLIEGKFVCTSITHAARKAGVRRHKIARNTELPTIKLSDRCLRVIVFPSSDDPPADRDLTRKQVAFIVGVSKWQVDTWAQSGKLPATPRPSRITPGNLATFLVTEKLLPEWINPWDWIRSRLKSTLPLVRVSKASELVGGKQIVKKLLSERKVQYLVLPGSHEALITQESLLTYLSTTPSLSRTQIARQFGLTPADIAGWQPTCTLHPHLDAGKLYKPCMVAILAAHISPGESAARWYEGRARSKYLLKTQERLAAQLGISTDEVVASARAGNIRGIQTPHGDWRFPFSKGELTAIREKEQRRQRRN
ncbi:MAG TPA: hypothetical protein VLA88_06320 [Candidatus Saccharimonadales bacterium]|nr:hypothetical protein [Candidatus Saccharimonadales bacterium]